MTMPEEYNDKRQYGKEEYIPPVECEGCGSYIPRDEILWDLEEEREVCEDCFYDKK